MTAQQDKTHCPNHHVYDEENTAYTKQGRVCITCRRIKKVFYTLARQQKINAKKECPCADCGTQFASWIMQFDHRPDEVKLFTIGGNIRKSWLAIEKEIAKCDVVCANCHADRTYQRRYAERDSIQ